MRTIFNYERGEDAYRRIAKSITRVESFYDFPETMAVFGESLRTSHLMSVNDNIFFRRLNKNVQLLGWYCDNAELYNVLEMLKRLGYKIGSRGYLYNADGLETKPYEPEYVVYRNNWSVDSVIDGQTKRQRKKMRSVLKTFPHEFRIDNNVTQEEAMQLHDLWVQEAASRHFMVVKGYSHRFIERHYMFGHGTQLYGIRRDGSSLHGLVGYEVFGSYAQMMVMKHRLDVDYFSRYMWLTALSKIFADNPNVGMVFCGASADALKQQLRFDKVMTYKVIV